MATAPISYGNDYAVDQSKIDRARAYAQLMQQQSMEQQPTQVINGWAIPQGKGAGIAKVLQSVAGPIGNYIADKKQQELIDKQKTDLQNTLKDAQSAYMGTPAQTTIPATPMDDEGNPMPTVNTPAVAGDPMKYANILMQNPQTAQMGMAAMQTAMQQQKWAQLLGGDAGATPSSGAVPGDATPAAGPSGGALLSGTGITTRDAQASLLADPTGKELMDKILAARTEGNKPTALREGDLVKQDANGNYISVYTQPKLEPGMQPIRGPNGQVIGAEPIPGYAGGMAGIKGAAAGAVSGAQAQNDMVTVNTPQGPVMMTRAQAAQQAGGAAPSAPANPQLAGLPPQVAAAIQSDMARTGTKSANFRIGPTDAPAGTSVAPQNIQTGQIGDAPPAPPAAPQRPGIPLLGDAQKAYETARAADFAKQASGFAQQGQSAAGQMRNLAELERIYADPNIAKGSLAENISGLKNLATSFGVDIKGLGGEQAAQAIANKMALDLRSTAEGGGMPGAMSDADRNFLANMTPNLSKSPEGRKQIIENMRRVSQRQIDISRMATAYEQSHGQIDVGFQKQVQDYVNSNPLFSQGGTGGWVIRPKP